MSTISNKNSNRNSYNKLSNITNNEQLVMISHELNVNDIDPYDLLSAKPLSLKSLLEKYNILRIKNHPDRGGEKENFIQISNTILNIKNILNITNNDKQFLSLKNDYYNSLNNETSNNLLEKFYDNHEFNINKFNKLFDELKYEDEDYGYELKQEKFEDYMPEKINFKDFHSKFLENKKKKKKDIIVHNYPEAFNNNDFNLISDTNRNFGSSKFTDYQSAFDESLMIDTNYEPLKKRSLEDIKKERLNIEMNDDELKLYENNIKSIENSELKRVERLKEYDIKINKYSKKMNNIFISD